MSDNQNRLARDMALVLCGMFARSNMGLEPPASEAISWAKQAGLKSPRASVAFFCRAFMAGDADEAMFVGEAETWLEQLSGLIIGEARKSWPGVVEVYEGG